MPAGQDGKAQRLAGLQQRQGRSITRKRGADAGGVAVQRDDRLVRDAPDQAQLVFGDGGAQGATAAVKPASDSAITSI
jgi:hypothetical protein